MEKRYQVFVSSTYEDLREEREEVIQALLELDCIPAGMELFPAADEDQWSLIKKVIEDCDYYLVIVGGRYGSVSPSGISYTQMEYEYAISQQKPVIGFVHKDPGSIPANKTEATEEGRKRLEVFRELVQQKMCKHWTTADELGSVISRSLVKLINSRPSVGWVRGNLVPDESSSQEILRLRKQIDELKGKLERSRYESPKGTEDLAQGNDQVFLNFYYECYEQHPIREGSNLMIDSKIGAHIGDAVLSWNQIFSHISPLMIDEASEETLKSSLNKLIRFHELDSLQNQHSTDGIRRIAIDGDDFNTIKVQLRALGLIVKSERQRSVRDTATYWTLTPYGDNVMTKLRAIRKNAKDTRVDAAAT